MSIAMNLLLGILLVSFGPVASNSLANETSETPRFDILPDSDQPISKEKSGTLSGIRDEAKMKQKFAIEPMDKSAIIGETIVLPCGVINKIGVLQWTQNGFGLGSDRKLERYPRYEMIGSDEGGDFSLQIKNVSLDDDATYQCQVGAADGGISGIRSRYASLIVFVPPEPPKIVQGNILRTTEGVSFELTCESYGGKPAAELTWIDGDGSPVTSGITYTEQFLSDGKRAKSSSKWTFISDRKHHGKEFSCRAENPALNQPQKASIRVEVNKPEIQSDKSEATNSVGTSMKTYSLKIYHGPILQSSLAFEYPAVDGQNVSLCETGNEYGIKNVSMLHLGVTIVVVVSVTMNVILLMKCRLDSNVCNYLSDIEKNFNVQPLYSPKNYECTQSYVSYDREHLHPPSLTQEESQQNHQHSTEFDGTLTTHV